ncbi:C-type lectin 5-like protein, partial [Leptotrombidium deliense]
PLKGHCDKYWYRFENKCYWRNETRVSRQENERNCKQMNSTMVSIHSEIEDEFIKQITSSELYYWLGGKRYSHGFLKWDDGSYWNYEKIRKNSFVNGSFINVQFKSGEWILYKDDYVAQLCSKDVDFSLNKNKSPVIVEDTVKDSSARMKFQNQKVMKHNQFEQANKQKIFLQFAESLRELNEDISNIRNDLKDVKHNLQLLVDKIV